MTREWIEPIYDRTLGSVKAVQLDPDQENPKGCWNDIDLNRLEKNTAYCAEWMVEQKIVRNEINIEVYENDYWQKNMIPTKSEINRIVSNIKQLVDLSKNNPAIASRLPNIYASATQPNYVLANQLEFALDLMHNQPRLPLDYWKVEIANGVITQVVRDDGTVERINSSEALVAEDEVVTIKGVPYGEHANYQTFTRWSGTAQDLLLLQPDAEQQEATFVMPYRDISYVANFKTRIPRKLTISNGYISANEDPTASSGPSTGTYFAGDRIMIIANIASFGLAFYEWRGTESALKQIVGVTSAEDPSVSILTMPDEDVALSPFYINAAGHYVTVNNGSGGGIYKYGTRVSISANVPSHYKFSRWSGNTNYLTSITSAYQSFTMPDNALEFTAHFEYVYSYNDVQVIDGLISVNGQNVAQASGLQQTKNFTLVPTPPDSSQGILNWTIEGYGSIGTDDLGNHTNTFTVGDGNAIITGHYAPIRNVSISNVNNGGSTSNYSLVQGRKQRFTTNSSVGNYRFNGWYENDTRISTSTTLTITMGESDRSIEARYDYYPTYTVTLMNKNNGGSTTTSQVLSGNYWSSSTNEEAGDYLFVRWLKDGSQVSTSTSYGFYVSGDTTITVEYRQKETYHLTVVNGTGSGDYKERQSINISADTSLGDFSNWSTSGIYSIGNSYSANTTVKLGRGNGTVTAHYNMRKITVITNSGTSTYNVRQDSYINVSSGTAPSTYEFSSWSRTSGDAEISNANSSSTRIYARTSDSTITCNYTPIPKFTVTMEDAEIYDGTNWVDSAIILRDSTNGIRVKQGSVPYGHQFLQWEVYIDGVLQTNTNYVEIYGPVAETTRLSKLRSNCTIKATFYVPDTTQQRTLTVNRKDGSTTQYTRPIGDRVTVYASQPDEGWEFYEWTGDLASAVTSALISPIQIQIPSENIQITETYIEKGARPKVTLHRSGIYGEMKYTTTSIDPETQEEVVTDHWTTDPHDYYVGEEVEIRMTEFSNEYYFGGWSAHAYSSEENLTEIISRTNPPDFPHTTTLTIPKVATVFEASLVRKGDVKVVLEDGFTGDKQTSATVYEGKKVDIRFAKEDTENIKYTFTRWTVLSGNYTPITSIELWDGGMFNPLIPGTEQEPIYIKMPATAVGLKANYTTAYKLALTDATIDETGETSGFYDEGQSVSITANKIEGMTFQYWDGDTDTVANKYDPTTIVTTVAGTTALKAVYSTDSEKNDIGYTTLSLKEESTVSNSDISVVSGILQIGFILTDSLGHIYVITGVNNGISTIVRLTRTYKGGDIYG